MFLKQAEVKTIIRQALREDLGSGDITSQALIPKNLQGKACIIAKEPAVLCGLNLAPYFFPKPFKYKLLFKDGDTATKNSLILEIQGSYKQLLEKERVFLNFLARLSGIASLTQKFVKKVKNNKIHILETRKTTPLLRAFEKYAVSTGGGTSHRYGLYDAILIKENHINASGGVTSAVLKAKKAYPKKKIEVEVKTLKELKEAIAAGADIVLLDNMSISQIKKAIKITEEKALIEVSGNVTLKNIDKYTRLHIDRISIGALTHSAPNIDFSMLINQVK